MIREAIRVRYILDVVAGTCCEGKCSAADLRSVRREVGSCSDPILGVGPTTLPSLPNQENGSSAVLMMNHCKVSIHLLTYWDESLQE